MICFRILIIRFLCIQFYKFGNNFYFSVSLLSFIELYSVQTKICTELIATLTYIFIVIDSLYPVITLIETR